MQIPEMMNKNHSVPRNQSDFFQQSKVKALSELMGEKYCRYCVKISSKIPNKPVIKITIISLHNSFLLQES